MALTNGISSAAITVLGTGVPGPLVYTSLTATLNPWRYNSSNPQHNSKSYDLFADITVGKYTYRISNWSDKQLVVTAPYSYP
jgi:hypothetical protein